MNDVSKLRTLFELDGVLYETIGYSDGRVVYVKPVREEDYAKCECGKPYPDQIHDFVLDSRNLQESITAIYKYEKVK